jgi:hypothetical protein
MSDTRVEVKLDADILGFVANMKRAERAVKSFNRLESRMVAARGMDAYLDKMNKKNISVKKSFDSLDQGTKMFGTALTKFLGLAIKGTLIQMAAMGVAMVALHGAFVIGNGLAKAYAGAMKLLAGGAAGMVVALSTAAAAMREQQAAMFAFSGRGASQFGSGTNQARVAMRGLATDADLAGLGMKNISKAYGAMAKSMSSTQILGSKNMIKALFDFGAAGQDPAQAAEKIGVVIEALQNSKKSFSEVQTAAKALGPQMEKAMTKLGITSKKKFQEALLSGELAKEGGVFGQFAAVNNTLIGRIKTFFNLIKEEFADFGQQFLEPAKVAMEKVMRIIKRDLMRMGGEIDAFGGARFFDSIVNAIDKVSNFFVNLMRKYLPESGSALNNIGGFFDRMARGWQNMVNHLRPFIDGAKVLEQIFSPIWESIKNNGITNFKLFNDELIKNSDDFKEFGERIAGVLDSIFETGRAFRTTIMESMPFINDVLSGVKQILDMLNGISAGFGSVFGPTGGLMAFSMISRQMKGTAGGLLGKVSGTMTLNPQTVVINAPGAAPMTFTPGGTPNRYGGVGTAPAGVGVAPPVAGAPRGVSSGGMIQTQYGLLPAPAGYTGPAIPAPIAAGNGRSRRFNIGLKTGREMYQVPGGQYYSTVTGRALGQRGTIGTTFREMRATRGGVALLGSKEMGISGAANSLGAKMGVGMGLAALSQVAPSEMQGALALGGTIGMFNPLAGLAAAGLGGAMSARSAGSGLLAGGAGGAAVGAMIAGPAGAAVGAAMGALGGAIFGASNKMVQELKAARKAAQGAVDSLQLVALQGVGARLQANVQAVSEGRSTIGSRASILGLTSEGRRVSRGFRKSIGGLLDRYQAPTQAKLDQLSGFDRTYGTGNAEYGKAVEMAQLNYGNTSTNQIVPGYANSYVEQMAKMEKARNENGFFSKAMAKSRYAETKYVSQETSGRKALMSRAGQTELGRLKGLGLKEKDIFGEGGEIKVTPEAIQGRLDKLVAQPLNKIYKDMFEKGMITAQQLADAQKQPLQMAKTFQNQMRATAKANRALETQSSARMQRLGEITGKTNAQLEAMAYEMGVNLYDPMITFTDLVDKLGLTLVKTAAQMRQANTDVFVEAGNVFKDIIKQNEAVEIIDEQSEAMRVALSGGTADEGGIIEFLDGIQSSLLQINQGDPLAAFNEFMSQIGTAGSMGTAFGPGGVFGNLTKEQKAAFFTSGTSDAIAKYRETALAGFRGTTADQINAMLAAEGKFVDSNVIKSALAKMTPEQQMAIMSGVQNTSVSEGPGGTKTYSFGGLGGVSGKAGTMSENIMSVLGLDKGITLQDIIKPSEEAMSAVAANFATWTPEVQKAMTDLAEKTGNLFTSINEKPEWMKADALRKVFIEAGIIKDTMTPRGSLVGDTTTSRLSQTMARHASIDGMLTGNRTITSSYRTYGLGSINSDHVTGRAIDLVGANLGQYKVMTEKAGGFAEFHGRGGTRHLHVVPGPGFIGDTSVPMAKSAPIVSAPFSNGSSVSNYNFYITGANASPEDIANRVMAKIQDQARAEMER